MLLQSYAFLCPHMSFGISYMFYCLHAKIYRLVNSKHIDINITFICDKLINEVGKSFHVYQ